MNVGCIPTKTLVRSAETVHTARRGAEFGFRVEGLEVDFPRVIARKNTTLSRVRGGLEKGLARNPNIELIRGHAHFTGRHDVDFGGRPVRGEKFIIATGVAPVRPDIPGLSEASYLTNETVMDLETLPISLLIFGGGPEGMEFGQIFARLGTQVTILQRRERVLPREEEAISHELEAVLREEGVDIRVRAHPTAVSGKYGQIVVEADVAGKPERFQATHLLLAAGRRPRHPKELGLDAAGVEADEHGAIQVDPELQTTAPHIWAMGDVIGRQQYTHFSVYTAAVSVANALTGAHRKVDYTRVLGAVFADPEVASVGLTEAAAVERGFSIKVGMQPFKYVGRALAMAETKGFVKFVVEAKTGQLLGMHVLGYMGADLLPQGVQAMGTGEGNLSPITDCVTVNPTLSETVKQAAGNLKPVEIPTAAGHLS